MTEWKTGAVRLAFKAELFGHVAVHMSISSTDSKRWRVSHKSTGYCCGKFTTEDTARRYAEMIGGHHSWSKIETDSEGALLCIPVEISELCKSSFAKLHEMGEE